MIEKEAKHFIDESFKTLRSAEAAFDMLLKFKHIRSREAINRQMMMKFNDILAQYGKEVMLRPVVVGPCCPPLPDPTYGLLYRPSGTCLWVTMEKRTG